jgi:hypothetical protein
MLAMDSQLCCVIILLNCEKDTEHKIYQGFYFVLFYFLMQSLAQAGPELYSPEYYL